MVGDAVGEGKRRKEKKEVEGKRRVVEMWLVGG